MSIYNNHPEQVFDSWVSDIKKKNEYGVLPINVVVSARLIVFAWAYASYQTYELKNRFGNINFVSCLEQVFLNKIAQIALALHCGYKENDILSGNSFVHLDPSSHDERYNSNIKLLSGNKPIVISGTKKFLYPTVDRFPSYGQLFVYIDAARYRSGKEIISRITIKNNELKATILGYGMKTDIRTHQSQNKLLEYSNKHSAFTGFENLRNINDLTYPRQHFTVPKYVEEIKNSEQIESKLLDIVTYIKNNTDSKPIVQIDYPLLFDPIIKSIKI